MASSSSGRTPTSRSGLVAELALIGICGRARRSAPGVGFRNAGLGSAGGVPGWAGAPKRRGGWVSKCRPGISRGAARGGGAAGGAAGGSTRRLAAPSGRCRWRAPELGRVLFLVPQTVVEAAEQAAVLLGGEPTVGIGLDVVDLAGLGGLKAMGMGAHAVTQFDGPAGPSGEQARAHADVDSVAQGEDGPLEVGRAHPRVEGRGCED